MISAFLASKQFIVSGLAALLILGGGAALYGPLAGTFNTFATPGCDPIALEGTAIPVERGDKRDSGATRRVVSYSLDASAFQGGDVQLCTGVGEIIVTPSDGSTVEVVFTIEARTEQALTDTEVLAQFGRAGDKLALGAWQETVGATGSIMSRHHAWTRLEVRLPQTGPYALLATSSIGDVRATDLLLSNASMSTDVGDVVATSLDALGDVDVMTDIGDVTLELRSVQSSTIEVSTDVGEVELRLPTRVDVGYHVIAKSDVGEATVSIGDTEHHDSDETGASHSIEARSRDYSAKPTRVSVLVSTDVGDIAVIAS